MAEPKRFESSSPADAADRDARAEALLVDGLDRYFSGQYEEAIHLWTRVLFFDRSHARARAYIDRARTALAERQRRTEEMLHRTGELLSSGQTDQARALLTQAIEASGDDEHAAELRTRLERVERARGAQEGHAAAAVVDAVPIGRWYGWPRARLIRTALLVLGALLVGSLASPVMETWLGERTVAPALPATGGGPTPTVLSSSAAALIRARTLYSRGRLAEALQALDRVDAASPEWTVADQLRIDIQQILLANRRGLSSSRAGGDAGRP